MLSEGPLAFHDPDGEMKAWRPEASKQAREKEKEGGRKERKKRKEGGTRRKKSCLVS